MDFQDVTDWQKTELASLTERFDFYCSVIENSENSLDSSEANTLFIKSLRKTAAKVKTQLLNFIFFLCVGYDIPCQSVMNAQCLRMIFCPTPTDIRFLNLLAMAQTGVLNMGLYDDIEEFLPIEILEPQQLSMTELVELRLLVTAYDKSLILYRRTENGSVWDFDNALCKSQFVFQKALE